MKAIMGYIKFILILSASCIVSNTLAQTLYAIPEGYNIMDFAHITTKTENGCLQIQIDAKTLYHNKQDYQFLHKAELIGTSPRFRRVGKYFEPVIIHSLTTDTTIFISLEPADTIIDHLELILTYKQSYIQQNWVFFKRYAEGEFAKVFSFELVNSEQKIMLPLPSLTNEVKPPRTSYETMKNARFEDTNDFLRKPEVELYQVKP